jgi:hypothetical protein
VESPNAPGPDQIREFSDRGTLWLLEDPQNVHDLLQIVDPTLADLLDFSRARRENRSFIPEDLRKQESDLIFRVPLVGSKEDEQEVWVYFLLEHQSTPDRLMPLRLYRYMGHLWDAQLREWQDRGRSVSSFRLHPVVPLVFYTGEERWEGPLRLADLMRASPELARFIPSWETLFLGLHLTPQETLTGLSTGVAAALTVFRAERAPLEELEQVVRNAFSRLEGLSEAQVGQWARVTWFFVLLAFHRREQQEYNRLEQTILGQARQSRFFQPQLERDITMTMAEYCEERGAARAEERLTREHLIKVVETRFGTLSSETADRIRQADVERLRVWFDRALTAATLEEVGITVSSAE